MRVIMLLVLALATAQVMPVFGVTAAFAQKSGFDKKAKKRAEQEAIRLAVSRGEVLPMPRLLAIAKGEVPGDVLKVELEAEDRSIVYEVKILTPSGRVREVELDARSGTLIKIEDD